MMVSQGLGHKAGPKEHNARSTLTITQGGMLLKVVAMVIAIVHNVEKAKLDLVHHQHQYIISTSSVSHLVSFHVFPSPARPLMGITNITKLPICLIAH